MCIWRLCVALDIKDYSSQVDFQRLWGLYLLVVKLQAHMLRRDTFNQQFIRITCHNYCTAAHHFITFMLKPRNLQYAAVTIVWTQLYNELPPGMHDECAQTILWSVSVIASLIRFRCTFMIHELFYDWSNNIMQNRDLIRLCDQDKLDY